MIDYGSVCSGIESVSVAVDPLGWKPAWFSEIEPFPSAVLEHRFPDVQNHGDMTQLPAKVLRGEIPAPAVLVGGTPCQAFSVAGMRQGLIDPRGALTIKFVELADAIDHVRSARGDAESIVWWENVPGVLSDKSNAFGCFLAALVGESEPLQPSGERWTDAGCVYGPQRAAAWRILDAQYFGLAQRRRRVFVVASARRGFDPASVLFESEGVRRDIAPRRGEGQDVATEPALRTFSGNQEQPIASTLQTTCDDYSRADSFNMVVHGTQDPNIRIDLAHALGRNNGQENAVLSVALRGREGGATAELGDDVAGCLRASSGGGDKPHVLAVAFVQNSRDEVRLMGGDGQIVGAPAAEAGMKQQCYVAIPIQNATRGKSQNGIGIGVHGAPMYTLDQGSQHGVCVTGDITHTLKAEGFDGSEDGTGRGQPIVSVTGESYASTKEADAAKALRALREAVGKEAFTQWGLGVLDSLQSPQVLRQTVHGCSVRCQACEGESRLDDSASSRPQAGAARTVCAMREAGRERRTPQGRQLAEQCARELGAHLSELPHSGASSKGFLLGMWQAGEGLGLLREALSALQEMGRPDADQEQSARPRSAVRRLMPVEAERLQGFPDDWTLIPWRNKTADECPDGPRYKAIGNSKAVPVVRWIARRIQNHI